MTRAKIYVYFSRISLFLFCTSLSLSAQNKTNGEKNVSEEKKEPFLQGIYVGADLFGLASSLFGSDYISYEASVHLNLKNKFFPVWEIGAGNGDATDDLGLELSTQTGIYNRIGLNYNMLNKKNEDFFYLGFRYGFSSFDYDIKNITINNGYWPGDYENEGPGVQSATIGWGEFMAGIQVRIISNVYMGWNIRYKVKLNEKVDTEDLKPWYIPGFGTGTSHWGINYSVFYKLPFF